MNTHTALIRSFGITGVLLALSLVLLAFVSAIVAFDRWPEGAGASAVERVAVEPTEARGVQTVVVRRAPVVRGVSAAPTSGSAPASGSGGALPAGPTSDGPSGRFGPPPPRVGTRPPGEGGSGLPRQVAGGPPPVEPPQQDVIKAAACGARKALGEAGSALDPACQPGRRGGQGPLVGALAQTGAIVREALGDGN